MTLKVPFFDLDRQLAALKPEMLKAFDAVYDRTAFCGGEFVDRFESEFKAYTGAAHCVGLNNGTNAIYAVLEALKIGPGDEVIVPASTFIASAWGISYCGAKPIFVDVDPETWTIDPRAVQAAINSRTRAVIGVHLYGNAFAVSEVLEIARKHNLHLIEDCAQAHGTLYDGRHVGTFGTAGCFSFYPSKNLGACGEGGAVTTTDAKLDRHMRMSRNQGSETRYRHETLGFNMRLNGMQAAMLSVKMPHLPRWAAERRAIADFYRREIRVLSLKFQRSTASADPCPHLFVVQMPERETFMAALQARGVQTALHYPTPCHLQPVYQELGYQAGDLPVSETIARNCVSLPLFPEMTSEERRHVVHVINEYQEDRLCSASASSATVTGAPT